MIQFIVNLLQWQEVPTPDREPPEIPTTIEGKDVFGQALLSYHASLNGQEAVWVKKLVPLLLKAGCNSKPPSDWKHLLSNGKWHHSSLMLQQLAHEWWGILQGAVTAHANGTTISLSHANLPMARAIIWLQLHLHHVSVVPDVLDCMQQCMHKWPEVDKVQVELARSAAAMLVIQPWFISWKEEILYHYPSLMLGGCGRVFKQTWQELAA
ncbi:MAG: hypothetical protein R2795_23225 [Saprospiraceae bacterium]